MVEEDVIEHTCRREPPGVPKPEQSKENLLSCTCDMEEELTRRIYFAVSQIENVEFYEADVDEAAHGSVSSEYSKEEYREQALQFLEEAQYLLDMLRSECETVNKNQ